jgi:hypothetical protein
MSSHDYEELMDYEDEHGVLPNGVTESRQMVGLLQQMVKATKTKKLF